MYRLCSQFTTHLVIMSCSNTMSYNYVVQYPKLEVHVLISKVQDDQTLIADHSKLAVSDQGQLDSSTSTEWGSTSEHSDLSFHCNQVPFIQNTTLGNYTFGFEPDFDLTAQGSYEYLFNTRYHRLHEDSVCRVGIPYGGVGGSIPPMDPQLDISQHFLQPVVCDGDSSRVTNARFDHREMGGSVLPMGPQLDMNQHFLQAAVHDSKSSQDASARFDPVGIRISNLWPKYKLTFSSVDSTNRTHVSCLTAGPRTYCSHTLRRR